MREKNPSFLHQPAYLLGYAYVKNTSNSLETLRRNFKGALKETLKYTLKFFGETFSLFFHSSEFLCSTLLIEEFQICIVAHSNIRNYSNYSNFPAAPKSD
jgi:hypothetical protein